MRRLRWQPGARRDIVEIAGYIAQDSPRTATIIVDRIRMAAETLRQFDLGRPSARAGVLSWPVRGLPYVLYFRRTNDDVEIVRLIHGARDLPQTGL